jgi:hypothetical protein
MLCKASHLTGFGFGLQVQLVWAIKVHAYAVTFFGAFLVIEASKRVFVKNFVV